MSNIRSGRVDSNPCLHKINKVLKGQIYPATSSVILRLSMLKIYVSIFLYKIYILTLSPWRAPFVSMPILLSAEPPRSQTS